MSASHEPLGVGQTTELRLPEKTYVWKIKKIDGGSEHILIMKVSVIMMYCDSFWLSHMMCNCKVLIFQGIFDVNTYLESVFLITVYA